MTLENDPQLDYNPDCHEDCLRKIKEQEALIKELRARNSELEAKLNGEPTLQITIGDNQKSEE